MTLCTLLNESTVKLVQNACMAQAPSGLCEWNDYAHTSIAM